MFRASKRPIVMATAGIAAFAIGFAVVRVLASRAELEHRDALYVAARDGTVGQPPRLLAATVRRLRLRLPYRRHST